MKKLLFIYVLSCLSCAPVRADTDPRPIWALPHAVTREPILEQLDWQGLRVRAQTLQIQIPFEQFTQEFINLLPEQALLTKEHDGFHFQWVHENTSYVLILQESSGFSTGLLSSVSLTRSAPATQPILFCRTDWLPDSLQPLFSMRDVVRPGLETSLEAYVSDKPVDVIRPLLVNNLKRTGWSVLVNPFAVDRTKSALTVDANCGATRLNMTLHKNAMQTHILVTRSEQ